MKLCLFHITDVHDLQHFVTIALATAAGGEDDLTRDKLSNLRTVGSGFAKLIYRLPQETGCMELEKRCESLWDSLSHDPSLPEKLVRMCAPGMMWYCPSLNPLQRTFDFYSQVFPVVRGKSPCAGAGNLIFEL